MSLRIKLLHEWLAIVLSTKTYTIIPILSDASFRRYFRVISSNKSWVVMDAPPEKENPDAFFRVARLMLIYEFPVPECISYNEENGFMLLTDFGDRQLFHYRNSRYCLSLYDIVIDNMIAFQKINSSLVPNYQQSKFISEMTLLQDWFYLLIRYEETVQARNIYNQLKIDLTNVCTSQPQTFIHRDYHCKNLMVLNLDKVGIIDFQDAVYGPITYDLVSLLRDCYVQLDNSYIDKKLRYVYTKYLHILNEYTFDDFKRWFDYVSLQRHTKCLGIFARLAIRDNKLSYLENIPRILKYIIDAAKDHKELYYFREFWIQEILPNYNKYKSK